MLKCATFFKELQCKVIEKNLRTFNEGYDQKEMRSLRDSVAANFIRTNCVKGIAKNKGLVAAGASVQRLGQCLNLDERVEAGTFEDKVRKGLLTLHPCNPSFHEFVSKISFLTLRCPFPKVNKGSTAESLREGVLKLWSPSGKEFRAVEWVSAEGFSCPKSLNPVRGKRYTRLASSKFCPSKMIELYHKALDLENSRCNSEAKRRRVDVLSEEERIKPLSELLESSEILRKICSIYPEIKTDTKVVRAGDYQSVLTDPMTFCDYLKSLESALGQLCRGDHLVVCGVPLLRRVDVAVLHIVSCCFEEVGFARYA